MGNSVTGILEQNEAGATYEGVVYDRFLTLRHASGRTLSIFDMGEPISTGLRIGETYEVVLVVAIPRPVRYFPTSPSMIEPSDWQGTVIEPHWWAPEGIYRRARPRLYEQNWILLATPLGGVLMSPNEISAPVSTGGCVQWQYLRLDLYGVV